MHTLSGIEEDVGVASRAFLAFKPSRHGTATQRGEIVYYGILHYSGRVEI